ncbi:ATP-binding cassette domain-containing protein [Noviherbaspirillum sp. CPCC 100848]|uniref:ATP-binding cassette domain-containing protein n=1 Tax=Noviherbaspirillum album TaxID=3080276 RepID=A0ABU6J857_9BURK|nr:ATP-binding cassette domain-containing protein [Noviherbaspirillum sp. CPCC 100848]MEC4719472.1 ATP-binding cassette domain-containing protein [Noviherbaspirillum sp. CPCC 100848]
MIRFLQVSLTRGIKPLLENVDLTLNPGDKIGLIGANGAGKSSLFAMLRGELHPDLGEVDFPAKWRMAYVAQETPALDRPALEYAIDGDAHLRQLEAELAALEQVPESAEHGNGHRIAELHAALADADAYTVRSRAEQLLAGLGFSHDQMQQPVASFSGGWRMRLNLAQALMCPSDLLLLDEPTNHLDLDAIIWLEDWLKRYEGTLIIISHDRDFLDGVVNVIVHIDNRKLKRYSGNYSAFERQRAAQMALTQAAAEKQARQRAHLQSFIDRFKAQATKARQAQSRMKMLARMEEIAPLRAAAEFSFEFREPLSAPNPLLVMEDVVAGYRIEHGGDIIEKPIVSRINFSLQTGQRIGLLGVNGAGKSTMVKTIAGEIASLAGDTRLGKGLSIGYFAQHQVEMLRHDESPLWHLAKIAPTTREQELRNFLGGFNFGGEMVTSKIAPFSGGEKARLALALIVWQRPNLLLLDEPTNHLDLETREALTMALAQFEGTLVLVSHDRHLLRATTDQFMIVADGRLQPFDGDLDDYKDWLLKTKLGKGEPSLPAANGKTAAPAEASPVASESREDRQERRRQEAEERQRLSTLRKPIESRIKRLDEQMAKLNARKSEVDAKLADSTIYDDANREALKQLILDQAYIAKELEQLETEWLEQQEALEQLSGN